MPSRYRTVEDIKKANADAGQFYFSRDTMRFFASRVLGRVFVNDADPGAWFVTSEKGPHDDSLRRYTVRYADERGHIDTVGEFQAHDTPRAAYQAAQLAAHHAINGSIKTLTAGVTVWNAHTNGLGDWCPWSGKRVPESAAEDAACPAGCPASRPQDEAEYEDRG